MINTLNKLIEKNLSKYGILELELAEEGYLFGKSFSYSLWLNEFDLNICELGAIDIDVFYSNYDKITYELGKYSLPIYTNSKANLIRLIELIIETDLNFSIELEKVEKSSKMFWDRYFISISGAKTTKMSELISMIEKLKQILTQVKEDELEKLPK
ncbi:conserved protein of unknown function [Streptococcus thermophilus]|nr:hypothetical protein [Streptococcus thermophilus]CAD0149479.1 conserved protein of unknown function [Streptococcus thermophilus]